MVLPIDQLLSQASQPLISFPAREPLKFFLVLNRGFFSYFLLKVLLVNRRRGAAAAAALKHMWVNKAVVEIEVACL